MTERSAASQSAERQPLAWATRTPVGPRLAWAATALGLAVVLAADGTPRRRIAGALLAVALCTIAAWLPRDRSRRTAAWISIAFGTIAAAAGATIAASYLTRTGISVKALGGLVAFAGGAVLVGWGGLRLLRATHGWRRLLAVPIVLVGGYALVVPIGVAVYATNVPRPELGTATPADHGLNYLEASFRTSDNVVLSGWYIPSTNRAAVVLLHGASSTRTAVLDQAAVLARHGFGVLLYDARGHGLSAGRAMDFGWYGDQDISAAVTYLQHRSDVDPERIGAVGMSMGGEESIGAMAADRRIKATVAEGATNRTFGDKQWLADKYGVRGRLQLGVEWVTYKLADLLTDASPPVSLREAVHEAAPRPVLLIAAGTVSEERSADESIRAASPSSVQVWVVPGATHTSGVRTAPDEWGRRVSAFLSRALVPG